MLEEKLRRERDEREISRERMERNAEKEEKSSGEMKGRMWRRGRAWPEWNRQGGMGSNRGKLLDGEVGVVGGGKEWNEFRRRGGGGGGRSWVWLEVEQGGMGTGGGGGGGGDGSGEKSCPIRGGSR